VSGRMPADDGPSESPALGIATVSGEIVHMVSARELVDFCEAKVLEGFRRRN